MCILSCCILQALQYLLKLCSHPLLVLGERPPDSLMSVLLELMPDSANIVSDLHELHHSPKLVALKEILEECGIGLDASSAEGTVGVGQHRVLIFAQHKVQIVFSKLCWKFSHFPVCLTITCYFIVFLMQSLLDIIERDLFQNHMKRYFLWLLCFALHVMCLCMFRCMSVWLFYYSQLWSASIFLLFQILLTSVLFLASIVQKLLVSIDFQKVLFSLTKWIIWFKAVSHTCGWMAQ